MLRRALLLGLPLALSCGSGGAADDEPGPGSAGATNGVPTTGDPGCILDPADCPPPALCESAACVEQRCVYAPIAADERDDDLPGDCRRQVCDGAGGGVPMEDATDVPDDGIACTADRCTPLGPENTPQAPGSACDDDGFCHADLHCAPCPERDGCLDDSPAEPNETQSAAHERPRRSDADGLDHACEALGSPGDVDWFRLDVVDLVIGKVAPTIELTPPELRVCVYLQCKQGGTTVQCPEGTVADHAPLGQLGCCGLGGFAPQLDCEGFNEDATLWLMVRHDPDAPGDPPACLDYQLGYEY